MDDLDEKTAQKAFKEKKSTGKAITSSETGAPLDNEDEQMRHSENKDIYIKTTTRPSLSKSLTASYASWKILRSIQALKFPSSGFGNVLGVTELDNLNGICYVYLNRHSICHELNPKQAMLQTLLHELVVSIYASSKVSLLNVYLW